MNLHGGIIIGVISDTRGLLRPEVWKVFEHAEYILHAGNIGDKKVLDGLHLRFPGSCRSW